MSVVECTDALKGHVIYGECGNWEQMVVIGSSGNQNKVMDHVRGHVTWFVVCCLSEVSEKQFVFVRRADVMHT